MVIMDLWGMAYHPVVVIAPIYILLLDSISACCEQPRRPYGHAGNYARGGGGGVGVRARHKVPRCFYITMLPRLAACLTTAFHGGGAH